MRCSGKAAIVAGAASGSGKHLALACAREGAAVAVADLNAGAADAVAAEIEGAGGEARGGAVDVTDERAVEAGVAAVAEAFGGVDILVSNAGIQSVHRVESFPLAEWKTVLAVHLDGAFLTTKACLKYMYAAASGSIIYMGSVHSKEASPLKAAYVTAKHGIIGLERVAAKEAAQHKLRANAIYAGSVRAPLVERQIQQQGN